MRTIGVIVVLAAAAPARADEATVAQQLYDQAKALEDEGKLERACPLFASSFKVDPQIGVELNLADCNEKLGKTATAAAQFRDAADRAHRSGDAKREDYARKRLTELAPKLVRLHVTAPTLAGLVIKLDDIDVTALVDTNMPVDPGTHALVASAPGYTSATQAITVDPAKPITNAEIPALAKAAVVADATQLTPEQLANALQAKQRAEQKQRDEGIAKIRGHVRPFVAVGTGPAFAPGAEFGYGIALGFVGSVGARLGFASSYEVLATARWFAGGDSGSRTLNGGATPPVNQTSQTLQGPMVDVTLRIRPSSPTSRWYVGVGAGVAYITPHETTGMGDMNTNPMSYSGSFVVPYGLLETGLVLGKREQLEITIFRLVIGSGPGYVVPDSVLGAHATGDNLVMGMLHVGYTFF